MIFYHYSNLVPEIYLDTENISNQILPDNPSSVKKHIVLVIVEFVQIIFIMETYFDIVLVNNISYSLSSSL